MLRHWDSHQHGDLMKLHLPKSSILDIDIEARPLGWYGGDWVHKEVTAIAWAWVFPDLDVEIHFAHITLEGGEVEMLEEFAEAYNLADMVTGHYIRGFDLPVLQSAYMEFDLPLLGPKMTHDTKGDLLKSQGGSKSQQNLAAELGIHNPKIGMTTADWRAANRLSPEGIQFALERVEGDVRQHMEMREEMLRRGWLRPPRVWTPDHGGYSPYTP